ncbi:MAG: hypothetical protein ND895_13070 [Pyrinomonadaceae bacterium]|nr:hypothetical protein [Pyrinomonadaceae bacterium]
MSGPDLRLAGLRRFAISISVLNLLGHTVLGFESSWSQMLVAVVAAYITEIVLEVIDAWANKRPCRFVGGVWKLIDFLLPAHIAGMAVAMLLYTGSLLLPFAFASAVGIASKAIFTAPVNKSRRHFLNPSNTGIVVTILLFPALAPIMPYQFTEHLSGVMSWAFPVLVISVGFFMNWRYSGRLPLALSWVIGFALQGVLRCLMNDLPLVVGLVPMTGVSFILFTFYMVTDPGSTPTDSREQVIFGFAIAMVYSLLVLAHVGFAFFYALFIVCVARGLYLHLQAVRLRTPAPAH